MTALRSFFSLIQCGRILGIETFYYMKHYGRTVAINSETVKLSIVNFNSQSRLVTGSLNI